MTRELRIAAYRAGWLTLVITGLNVRVDAATPSSPAPSAAVPASSPSAAPLASPAPGASPSPAATARPLGFRAQTQASFTFVDQNTSGPGQTPPEAAGFIAGSPLAPNTPYDLLSSAPLVPGVAGVGEVVSTLGYGFSRFDVGLTAALGSVNGSVSNAAYWSENLLPFFNPHLGSRALPYAVVFPTHPGADDAATARLGVLGASVATADGNLQLRGGWFDLQQTDRFVFAQPALTSVNPSLAFAPAETLGDGPPAAAWWEPDAEALPLDGVDVVAKHGPATLEVTNAALPSLPGDSARLSMASLVDDHGEGTRYTLQVLHAQTSGTPFTTTVPFGADPQFTPTPQGILPTSTLSGQRQTIVGASAAVHLVPLLGLDGVVEVGRAWYDAAPVARPGTEAPGGYYHAGLSQVHGRGTASIDAYRMEPRYATMILPYGIPENQWSAAFAWPGQWLKSNYQLIDNSVLGVNRQGYRLRYFLDGGPLEIHLEYTDLRQIDPETTQTATQAGYVDGYYLPQLPSDATFGRQKRYGFWGAWHPRLGDVTIDVVDDTLYRPFVAGQLQDRVSYEVPQTTLTYSRHLSENVIVATGLARYAMKGTFAEPLDFAQRLFFAGVEFRAGRASTLVSFRRTAFGGITTYPPSPLSPDFTGSALIVEQRYRF